MTNLMPVATPNFDRSTPENTAPNMMDNSQQLQAQQPSVEEDIDQDVSMLDGSNDKKPKKAADTTVSCNMSCFSPMHTCLDKGWRWACGSLISG